MITLPFSTYFDTRPFLTDEVLAAGRARPLILEASANLALRPEHNGAIIKLTSETATAVTVPADLPLGFSCGIAQWGAGAVSFVADGGAVNRSPFTATTRQYGLVFIIVMAPAEFIVGGDV
jgi:hypothetical protein